MTRARRPILRIGALVLLAVLLLAFGRHVDWRSAAQAVRAADPVLLACALLLNLLSLTLKGVRWWVFLRPLGDVPLPLVVRATFAGASLNNLVVAQGGEGARVLLVSRAANVSSAGVLAALGLERALDIVSYLVLLVGAAWMLALPAHIVRWRLAASVMLVVVALALVALGFSAEKNGAHHVRTGTRGRIAEYLRRVRGSLALVASPGRLAVATVLSVLAWALQVATYHLTVLAAHLPLPLAGSVAAMLAIGISFLIRATPGNVGVFQVIYALTVRSFGIAEGPAVAVALLIQTLQVLPTIALGMLVAPRLLREPELAPPDSSGWKA
jgi:uncharacterized protein (TIRG00374 family)